LWGGLCLGVVGVGGGVFFTMVNRDISNSYQAVLPLGRLHTYAYLLRFAPFICRNTIGYRLREILRS